jgi:hypothetical protein
MQVKDVGVVTITLVRNTNERRTLLNALNVLRECKLPVVAAHGGEAKKFVQALRQFGFQVEIPDQKGLVRQVKAGLRAALKAWPARAILYTEPDKYPFFGKKLTHFISSATGADVMIAGRDEGSFRTFPGGQQWTEAFTNEAARLVLGNEGDYCYGPLLLSRKAAEIALDAPENLGWGWRFWLMARIKSEGRKLQIVTMNFPCPKEQRGEDRRADRMYRLKQMRQNLEGMELGSVK